MNLEKIKTLVAAGESHILEFKTSTAKLKSAFETVCGFLNNKGGTVLIGVNNTGKIIGQEIADSTRQDIAKEINLIEPATNIEIDYIPVHENQYVIAIQADANANHHAPYTYDSRAFQRTQSTTCRMSQHLYEQLLVERGQLNHSWEEAIDSDYSLNDLNHEEIYKTIADGIRENRIPASAQKDNIEQILERLNLIVKGQLKRGAVVLYAKEKSLQYVQCMIKMARFKGFNKLGDFIDNQQIKGNAFQLLSDADAFLRRHLPIASSFKSDQFKRVDKPALPVMAVREALINAICHRNYADRSTDIALAIYDDRIEIWNSGVLPKKITIENLKHKHQSILRNKLIANAFYVRGYIEKWGTGTNKMIDLCKEDDIPEPEFEEEYEGLSVVFKFKEPIGTILTTKAKKPTLSIREERILELIKKEGRMSIQKIVTALENPPSQRMIRKDLNNIRKQGMIALQGHGRNALWIIKPTKTHD